MGHGDPYRTAARIDEPAPKCKRCGHQHHSYFRRCRECKCIRGYDILFWFFVPIVVFLFLSMVAVRIHYDDLFRHHYSEIAMNPISTLKVLAKMSVVATLFLYVIDRMHRRQIKRLEAAVEPPPMESSDVRNEFPFAESSGVRVELAEPATSPNQSTGAAPNHGDQETPALEHENEASREATRART